MAKIINLDADGKIGFREMIDETKADDVTHAVVCYREKDGSLHYRTFGADHVTYLVGMLDRVKQCLHHHDSHE